MRRADIDLAARSAMPDLASVLRAGVETVLMSGDADWICNWQGNQDVARQVQWPGQKRFQKERLQDYFFNGDWMGQYKTVDNLGLVSVAQGSHSFGAQC